MIIEISLRYNFNWHVGGLYTTIIPIPFLEFDNKYFFDQTYLGRISQFHCTLQHRTLPFWTIRQDQTLVVRISSWRLGDDLS